MSEMYSLRVLTAEENKLTCRVTVEYSGEPLTPDRTLAFRFVWEPWFDLCDGKSYRPPEEGYGGAMSAQEAKEKGQRAALTLALAGQDMNDLDWCVANADRFIACVGVTDHVNYTDPDFDEDDSSGDLDEKPQATYTIIVTDPAWIEHFSPGMWWPITGFAGDVWSREVYGWLNPTVTSLVYGIDTENALDRLPILADALEEAGCNDAAILNHCWSEREHTRGCWVVHFLQHAVRRLG